MISDLEISSEFKPNQSINSKLIVIPDKLTNAINVLQTLEVNLQVVCLKLTSTEPSNKSKS